MGKIKIFIDTNILLALYGVGSDDLNQFKQLLDMMEDSIEVVLPDQVKNEFYRNRDTVLDHIISKLEKFPNSYPTILRENTDFKDIQKDIKELKGKYDGIIKATKEASAAETLAADITIKEIFNKSTWFKTTAIITERAKTRMDIGNPPGKGKSYGDAINWEVLLENISDGNDLFFITGDKDYLSKLDSEKFSSYLLTEWRNKKNSEIKYFKSLNALLNSTDLQVELQKNENKSAPEISEIISKIDLGSSKDKKNNGEQDELVQKLRDSINFATTHSIIQNLSSFHEWTDDQLVTLAEALVFNSQINFIISDSDVLNFYKSLNLVNVLFSADNFDIVSKAMDIIEEA